MIETEILQEQKHLKTLLASHQESAEALLGTVRPHFPAVLSNDAPVVKRLAAGIVARIVGSTEAALCLLELERRADLVVVVRSLFEHVVMLAWITGDVAKGPERAARWQADDEISRGKVDDELSPLRGSRILNPENRERVDTVRSKVGKGRSLPPLTQMAETADREWQGRFGFVKAKTPGDQM